MLVMRLKDRYSRRSAQQWYGPRNQGTKIQPEVYLAEVFLNPPEVMDVCAFGSWMSAPKCLFLFQNFDGRPKVLPPDVCRIRMDVHRISGPKTYSLGCFFVLEKWAQALFAQTSWAPPWLGPAHPCKILGYLGKFLFLGFLGVPKPGCFNLVVCTFYAEALFCALLCPFALFCALLWVSASDCV